ncbi:MAG: hypothetical protein IJ824_00730 [Alphaproteobacteria bacterium]|mgnify:CR=1 FL=1|jgi:F-type H+-transporting ATPase subunit b|nr:hypothetical protein [Alphaproteobacteria bacterium]
MPQLDWSTYLSQAFWLLVCFCALWILLANLVTPKLADVIEQRKRKINDYVEKAEQLNRQAQNSLLKYQQTLAEAQAQAQKQLDIGRAELKAKLDAKAAKMTKEINQKIADSELVLATEKQETLQQIEAISQDLAYHIVQKLGFNNISKKDIALIALEEKDNG